MPRPSEHQANFVEYLVGLSDRENRGALAALRRGVGKPPGTVPETFPIMVPWTGSLKSRREADCYFLVGALFALHPQNTTQGNMGTTFALMPDPSDSLEKRFVALLNADAEDLRNHLRHAVSLAGSKEVPVNWAQLLADLRHWDHPDRFVQRDWAEQYWGHSQPAEDEGTTEPTGSE